MIRTATIMLNGVEYIRTYSDAGRMIEREGVLYDEAIDPVGSGRTYKESSESPENAVEIDDTEALEIILGGTL